MDELIRPGGSLAEIGYPEILRKLHDQGFSGALVLAREGVEKTVQLRAGNVVFARSNNPNDRLGEFLLRRGVINVPQYVESAARIGPSKRQGTVLCEIGAISPDDLMSYVKEQVIEIICSLFEWPTGSYAVHQGEDGSEETIVLSIPIDDVILQGVRRVTDWHRVWDGIGASLEAEFAPTASAASLAYRATLSEDEAHVLSFVNGRLGVDRILGLSYAANFETCRILWALRLVGAIEPVRGEPGSRPRDAEAAGEDYVLAERVEAFAEVFASIYAFVDARLGDLVDHFVDRVVEQAVAVHPVALAGVHLRNQGRVEYEQLFANLGGLAVEERRNAASAALAGLLTLLLDHVTRELGADEERTLLDELEGRREGLQLVPLDQLLPLRRANATASDAVEERRESE